MAIKIRETREEDFEGIASLLKDTKLADPYFSEEKFRKFLGRNRGYCHVAEDGVKIVGSIFATHDGAFRGYIQKLAVTEEYRRRGVASRLMEITIRRLEETEIPLIFTHVEKGNKPSIELLTSLGFEIRNSHYLVDRGYKPR